MQHFQDLKGFGQAVEQDGAAGIQFSYDRTE